MKDLKSSTRRAGQESRQRHSVVMMRTYCTNFNDLPAVKDKYAERFIGKVLILHLFGLVVGATLTNCKDKHYISISIFNKLADKYVQNCI